METGMDEAGRGPVMGPLVVAGVRADPARLTAMGCKDSKRLSASQRERLARLLHSDPDIDIEVRTIAPDVLDGEMMWASLNDIEVLRFQEIARALPASRIIVDAADVDAARFGRRIEAAVPGCTIVAEHKADDRHVVVAAASIIAKVVRDEAVARLGKRLERRLDMVLGSGYPSDPKTIAFLEAWLDRFGDLPDGTRHRWKTARRLLDRHRTPPLDV